VQLPVPVPVRYRTISGIPGTYTAPVMTAGWPAAVALCLETSGFSTLCIAIYSGQQCPQASRINFLRLTPYPGTSTILSYQYLVYHRTMRELPPTAWPSNRTQQKHRSSYSAAPVQFTVHTVGATPNISITKYQIEKTIAVLSSQFSGKPQR
jgi:hypothetical protein